MTDKPQQAFPTLSSTNAIGPDGRETHAQNHYSEPGMTLRDFFAAHALAGLLACPSTAANDRGQFAREAYAYADEMMKAREGK